MPVICPTCQIYFATLAVFAVVNLALLRLKYRRVPSSAAHVNIPIWMPAAGLVSCVVMIVAALSG